MALWVIVSHAALRTLRSFFHLRDLRPDEQSKAETKLRCRWRREVITSISGVERGERHEQHGGFQHGRKKNVARRHIKKTEELFSSFPALFHCAAPAAPTDQIFSFTVDATLTSQPRLAQPTALPQLLTVREHRRVFARRDRVLLWIKSSSPGFQQLLWPSAPSLCLLGKSVLRGSL